MSRGYGTIWVFVERVIARLPSPSYSHGPYSSSSSSSYSPSEWATTWLLRPSLLCLFIRLRERRDDRGRSEGTRVEESRPMDFDAKASRWVPAPPLCKVEIHGKTAKNKVIWPQRGAWNLCNVFRRLR